MTFQIVAALLIVAGAALVFQNVLMAQMTAQTSNVLVTLILNSAVGLAALTALLFLRNGIAGFGEIVAAIRPVSVLPGLLGSFFVFASIAGYQKIGAAATISMLVGSQLVFGIAFDIARSGATQGLLSAIAGMALLMGGVMLIVFRPG